MAAISNLNIDQGTDFEVSVSLFDKELNPFDLREYVLDANNNNNPTFQTPGTYPVIKGQIRKSFNSIKSYEFDIQVIDAINGVVVLRLPYTVSNTMKPGRYIYDIEVKSFNVVIGQPMVERILQGNILLSGNVTKLI